MMSFRKKRRGRINLSQEITPDEILVDASNVSGLDTNQFEGRIEKPITMKTFLAVGIIFTLIFLIFAFRVVSLQIVRGESFAEISERNSLRESIIFADRGIIYDVKNTPLAWNEAKVGDDMTSVGDDFNYRRYIETPGFSNLLGYVKYPRKDSAGFYFDEDISGVEGIELIYNDLLAGDNGSEIIEIDALGDVKKGSTTKKPVSGDDLHLTIDAEVQENFRNAIVKIITENGFQGGGGIIMDVVTGDVLSLVSYPEFDSNLFTEGEDTKAIESQLNDPFNPFLNRVTDGLYTPGSIVKPYMALAALDTGVINPNTEILSVKEMVVPNPYNPSLPSIFTDWKAHGYVNVKSALAYSSNVFFYQVGGGYENQEGVGITKINEYMRKFGFGESIDSNEFPRVKGTIPNPEWKREVFDDDWRLGDTYFTSIGQYGFQVTPLQIVTAVAAIANNGTLIEPRLTLGSGGGGNSAGPNIRRQIDIPQKYFDIVKEGMREVVEYGTGKGLSYDDFAIAAKTGTAELGVSKERVNSWVTGFWPYENPRFSFAIVLEKGSRSNLIGGVAAARTFFDWLKWNKEEYLE
jgi:penicillin-binding protein 2